MSPKSPTGDNTDQETLFSSKMPDPDNHVNDIPLAQTTPPKRDMIVEINGDQKTTIRTTSNGGGVKSPDQQNVCKNQGDSMKGKRLNTKLVFVKRK